MNTQSRVLRWSLIIGIVILLNLFFNYALSLVYKQPDFIAYCPQPQVVNIPETQNACTSAGGQWTDNVYYGKPVPSDLNQPRGYCDLQYTCRQTFESANKAYNRNVFIVLVVLGAISVLIASYFSKNAVITNGLALGGVLSFIIASLRYWSAANDLFRVVILAIALGILFWVAMKKFNDRIRS